SHGRTDPRGDLGQGRVEDHAGGELPAEAQVLLQYGDRVETRWRYEALTGRPHRADPVDPVGADRVRAVGVAQQVPAPVPDDDGPGIHLRLPLAAGLAAVRDRHAAPRRDGLDEFAGDDGIRAGRVGVGGGRGV